MNRSETQMIRIDLIDVKERLRQIDMDYAALLASSMKEIGQLQPVEVRPTKGGRFELVAGAHRLEGAKVNEWSEILAVVRKSSDMEAEIRQIDENLIRHDLNPLDRATFLARRQEIYIQLNPQAAGRKASATARWHATADLSFASNAAAKMGVSDRDVRRSIARFTKIAPDVRKKIAGTWIAFKGSELDALARCGPQEQRKVVKLMLQEVLPAKSVKAARHAMHEGPDLLEDVDAEQLARLQGAWRKGGAKARAQFLDWLAMGADPALLGWIKRAEG